MADRYWANAPADEIAGEIGERVDEFDRWLQNTGRIQLCWRALDTYYGFDPAGGWARSSAVTFGGEQGETVLLRLNHFRSLVDQRVILVTGQRPSFEAMATNNSMESAEQCQLAERIFDYHLSRGGLEEDGKESVKRCGVTGEGWMFVGWDPHKGDVYGVDPDTGSRVYTGEPCFRVFSMYDVARDVTLPTFDHQWLIARRFENKWDLIAKYPEKAEEIKSISIREFLQNPESPYRHAVSYSSATPESDDLICIYEFYHDRTPAMPDGRMVLTAGNTVLFDGPNPYQELPFYCIAEDYEPDTCFGHTRNWDLIAPQQAVDAAISTATTNHDAFGIQNIIMPHGAGIEPEDLGGGLRLLKVNAGVGEPKALQLTQTGEHSYRLINLLVENMETLSSINSVARGNPQASLKSGSALALVQSMAVQGNSSLANAYVRFMESIGSALIRRYQQFASMPHLIEIVGNDKRSAVETFTGEKLSSVRRVSITLGGPLTRTQSGRMEIASDLAERWPQVVTPAQYMQVLDTGRLDNITEEPTSEPNYLIWENEQLQKGIDPTALFIEDHQLHIKHHKILLNDPDVRTKPEYEPVRRVILEHIKQHMEFERAQAAESAPPPKANKTDGPSPGAPPPEAQKDPNYQNTSGKPGGGPMMPKNPLTNQRTSPGGNNAGP